MATAHPHTAAIDYCRRARRIRASFCRDPFLRQRALTDLNTERDAQTRINASARIQTARRRIPPLNPQPSAATVEARFAEAATDRLQPFGFTFSDRVALLNAAERLGIPRFRANLILALQEHGAQAKRPMTAVEPAKPVIPSLVMILAFEAIAVAGLVWLCGMM